ncbi:MAG: hypothetical protein IBJ03_02190 [Gemmatimonadaceae bacterium]|nr:hypothetical protein [Gemmatimonadaceae bacterium]
MSLRHVLAAGSVWATIAIAVTLAPAHRVQAQSAPSCAKTLDSLDAKIRGNYAGFLLEVRDQRRVAYDRMRVELMREAQARTLDDCFATMRRFVDWFADPHLFVFQSATVDSAAAAAGRASVRQLPVNEDMLRRELKARGARRDPIEGIWYDGQTRMAVVRESGNGPQRFAAVLLNADTTGWRTGHVRAEFIRVREGVYDVTLRTRAFAVQRLDGRLHRNTILRLSPGMWGKAWPVAASDSGLLDTVDVHRPRVVVRSQSVVVSIPSHDPRYTRLLDSLVAAADTAIRARSLLIVDLRGNEGGSSLMSRAIHPYVATAVSRSTPYDTGTPVMLSSPAQIAYAKRAFGSDTSAFVRSLVQRLEAAPGTLVPLDTTSPTPPRPEPSHAGGWRVAVLVDGGTVSAAEVLVLRALRSERAVVLGQPTAGALDYQSTQIVSLGTGDRRWALGYPTITAHVDLPARGMRGRGIMPQQRVDWTKVRDAYAEVERRLR